MQQDNTAVKYWMGVNFHKFRPFFGLNKNTPVMLLGRAYHTHAAMQQDNTAVNYWMGVNFNKFRPFSVLAKTPLPTWVNGTSLIRIRGDHY
jgi:hypothetical protein